MKESKDTKIEMKTEKKPVFVKEKKENEGKKEKIMSKIQGYGIPEFQIHKNIANIDRLKLLKAKQKKEKKKSEDTQQEKNERNTK